MYICLHSSTSLTSVNICGVEADVFRGCTKCFRRGEEVGDMSSDAFRGGQMFSDGCRDVVRCLQMCADVFRCHFTISKPLVKCFQMGFSDGINVLDLQWFTTPASIKFHFGLNVSKRTIDRRLIEHGLYGRVGKLCYCDVSDYYSTRIGWELYRS